MVTLEQLIGRDSVMAKKSDINPLTGERDMPPAWRAVPVYVDHILRVLRHTTMVLNAPTLYDAYRHTPIYRSSHRSIPTTVLAGLVDRDALWGIGWRLRGDPVYMFADIASMYLVVRGTVEPEWADPEHPERAIVYVNVSTRANDNASDRGNGDSG